MALAEVFEAFAGPEAPVEFTAYDGSHAGAAGSPVKITVRSPAAVAYLAQAPGELGLARAYVAGQLDVEGDMYEALARITKPQCISMTMAEKLRLLAGPRRPEAAGAPDAAAAAGSHADPPLADRPNALQDPRRQGHLPSLRRLQPVLRVGARAVDGVHLRLLPPPGRDPGRGAGAQVRPGRPQAGAAGEGMRLLDVGCGWGGMVMHAAREYGVKALGVTLSAQQAAWAQAAIEREGLSGLAEVRHLDYRDVPETGFDAVSSIGLTEHVGKANLPVLLLLPVRQAEGRRAAAEPLHHPARQHRARPSASAGSSTGTSSPTASSRGPAT